MKYQAVIFDLDGVICHTDEYHYMAWKQIADRLQIPFNPAINHRMRGIDRMASLDVLLGQSCRDFSREEKEQIATEKNQIYRELLGNLSPASVSSDVMETLERLRATGLKLAIGSSSKNTKYILERIGLLDYFDGISDGTTVKHTKPDPEVFLQAAERIGVTPEKCLVVEDARSGILAAKAAGMDSAAVGEATECGMATFQLKKVSDVLRLIIMDEPTNGASGHETSDKKGEAMIVAADIGGTKLLFGLFETSGERPSLVYLQRYSSLEFTSLEEAADSFLNGLPGDLSDREIQSACFSVAGPVMEGRCRMINLGWEISESGLLERFPMLNRIQIRNDMEAMGKGLSLVAPEDLVSLLPAQHLKPVGQTFQSVEADEVKCVLVPGTGLGEAFMTGGKVMASEGGHCDFGPRDRLQTELWDFLHREMGHVSYERILSGEGFCRLVRFLMDEKGMDHVDFPLVPETITKRAQTGSDEICVTAVEMFAGILGAEAGNLALKTMALGGVYLGGNIVREILPWLQTSCFADGFFDKGRFSELMESISVYAVMDNNTALYGSAMMAFEVGR